MVDDAHRHLGVNVENDEARLEFRQLKLSGFGPYRDGVVVDFPSGLGVLQAPNEHGKSTIMAALSAVLFGLPTSSDRSAFGSARYRNWEEPSRFEGELLLSFGRKEYRVWRRFDNHRVRVFLRTKDGWKEHVVGEHNPNARRRNQAYVNWLESLFGHTSRELFEATFCVAQPLPPTERVDDDLQGHLTGSGGEGHRNALDWLLAEARAITSATKERGLSQRDGLKPGRLDDLKARAAQLQRDIEAGREATQSLHTVAAQIISLREEVKQHEDRLKDVNRTLKAVETWQRQGQQIRDLSKEAARLNRHVQEVGRIQEQLDGLNQQIKADYAEFHGVDDDFGDALEKMEQVIEGLKTIEELVDEVERIDRRLEAIEEEKKEQWLVAPQNETATSWLDRAKSACAEVRSAWSAYQGKREVLVQLHDQTATWYAPFEEAAPSLLELVEGYENEKARLTSLLEEQSEARLRAESTRASVTKAWDDLKSRYHDVVDFEENIDEIVKLEQAKRKESELVTALDDRKRVEWGMGLLRGFLGGTGLLAMAPLISQVDWSLKVVLLVMGMALIAMAALFPRIPLMQNITKARAAAEEELQVAKAQAAEIESRFPRLASLDPDVLHQMQERIHRFIEAKELLPKGDENLDEQIEELQKREQATARSLEMLESEMESLKEHFDDVDQAYKRWLQLKKDIQQAQEQLEREVSRWGLEEASAIDVADEPALKLVGPWDTWRHFLKQTQMGNSLTQAGRDSFLTAGSSNRELTIGQLVGHAFNVSEEDWSRWQDVANEVDAKTREVQSLAAKRNQLMPDDDGENGTIQAHIDAVSNRVEELGQQFGGDWSSFLEAALKAVFQVGSEEAKLEETFQLLPTPFDAVLNKADADIAQARLRWRERQNLTRKAEECRTHLAGIFGAWQVKDEAELEERLIPLHARINGLQQSLEELSRNHPALPAWSNELDLSEVDARVNSIRSEAESLEQAIEQKQKQLTDLTMRQAQLQGENPVNVAQAELELAALMEEETRLSLEIQAITIAHQELRTAADRFYESHLERLQEAASHYFATFTKDSSRRVVLDEKAGVGMIDSQGHTIALHQLSQGAKDQLYLALRLAVGDLLGTRRLIPFLFDDPFVNCDAHRLQAIGQALTATSARRQILLFTHDEALLPWGKPIKVQRMFHNEPVQFVEEGTS